MKLFANFNIDMVFLLKKIISNLKKLCSSSIYIQFSDDTIIFSNLIEQSSTSLIYYFIFSTKHFLIFPDSIIQSKQPSNAFTIKLEDFSAFSQKITTLPENLSSLNLSLVKEGESRFLKVHIQQGNHIESVLKADISLTNNSIEPFDVDNCLIIFSINSKDLGKIGEIVGRENSTIKIKLKALKGFVFLQFSIKEPCKMKISFKDIPMKYSKLNTGFAKSYFYIANAGKNLANISQFNENLDLCLLDNEKLGIIIQEKDQEGGFMSSMCFLLPEIEDFDTQIKKEEMIEENKEALEILNEI